MAAIQMAALLMVVGAKPFNFAQTISADTLNYNLRAAAVAAGWNQTDPLNATVTINPGVYVGSSTTAGYGFDTGAPFPAGTTLALVNNGFIVGAGGNGGDCAQAIDGSPGGPALRAQAAITITNNGTIGGGGGGGGGSRTFVSGRGYFYYGGGGGRGYLGGAGGGGSSQAASGDAGSKTAAGRGGGGGSGAGGDLGGAGSAGQYGPGIVPGDAGGAAGAAVVGNANITWTVTGTRLGSIT